MTYLLFQMMLYMLVTLVLGVAFGWYLWGRGWADNVTDFFGVSVPVRHAEGDGDEVVRLRAELAENQKQHARTKSEMEACRAGSSATTPRAPASKAATPTSAGSQPEGLTAPREGGADDLKKISGIGPKLETMLHNMGIFHFSQIAEWGDEELAWVDGNLEGFQGRASRDEWVRQARDFV